MAMAGEKWRQHRAFFIHNQVNAGTLGRVLKNVSGTGGKGISGDNVEILRRDKISLPLFTCSIQQRDWHICTCHAGPSGGQTMIWSRASRP